MDGTFELAKSAIQSLVALSKGQKDSKRDLPKLLNMMIKTLIDPYSLPFLFSCIFMHLFSLPRQVPAIFLTRFFRSDLPLPPS